MKKVVSVLAISLLAGLSSVASAQSEHAGHALAASSAAATLTDGEVRKVDKEAKKVTLRHGPIQNLDMPGMTMVFQVQDVAVLDQVKAGDKVKFAAEKIGGAITVTRLEAAN